MNIRASLRHSVVRSGRHLAAVALVAAAAPLCAASGELKLFRDRNFAGPATVLAEANSSFKVSPRSVRVGGAVWLLCERPFFGGRCQEVKEDSGKLTLHRAFSGTVKSARPVSIPAPAAEKRGDPAASEQPATPVVAPTAPEPPKR